MALSTFTMLCNQYHYFQNFPILPNRNSVLVKGELPILPTPPAPGNYYASLPLKICLFQVPYISGFIYVPLSLAYFTYHNISKFTHVVVCIRISFPFKAMYFIVCMPHIVYPFIWGWTSGLFPAFGYCE